MFFNYKITTDNTIHFLELEGELIDKNQAIELIKNIEELIEGANCKVIMNLSELKYMNSSGLNVLIQLLTKTRIKGGDSVIYNVNKKINELLIITKLNSLFKIASTKEEAIELLK